MKKMLQNNVFIAGVHWIFRNFFYAQKLRVNIPFHINRAEKHIKKRRHGQTSPKNGNQLTDGDVYKRKEKINGRRN